MSHHKRTYGEYAAMPSQIWKFENDCVMRNEVVPRHYTWMPPTGAPDFVDAFGVATMAHSTTFKRSQMDTCINYTYIDENGKRRYSDNPLSRAWQYVYLHAHAYPSKYDYGPWLVTHTPENDAAVWNDLGSLIYHPYLVFPRAALPLDEQDIHELRNAFWTKVDNAGFDKDMDLANSISESPGILDYAKEMVGKTKTVAQKVGASAIFHAFSLVPLALDMATFANSCLNTPSLIDKFLGDREGDYVSKHITHEQSVKIVPPDPEYSMESNTYTWKTTHAYCKYKAKAVVRYNVEQINDFSAEWKILKRIYGFDNLFTFAWEKMPYSWFVDYWCNLGDVLSAMTAHRVFEYTIGGFNESFHSVRKSKCRVHWMSSHNDELKSVADIESHSYDRRVVPIPRPEWWQLFAKLPGWRQFYITSSLALANGLLGKPNKKGKNT